MKNLFNSNGEHIANFINEQLYLPSGANIGHFLKDQNIFIDMNGKYLGEIVQNNRLMRRTNSSYSSINFGSYGNYGNIGNYGNPGNYGSIGSVGGYEDVVFNY
jgi:hypothetical protein